MKTSLIEVDPSAPDPDSIKQAARIIRKGGLVAFPTETVYGLGANALDPSATQRIFEAKGRPTTDPLIVHIHHIDQLAQVATDIPAIAYDLARVLWPGPLTLVLHRHSKVAANVAAGRDTVAVRMPDHPVALALIDASGVPIAAPSANLFAHPSPTTAQHVLDDLEGRVGMVLDGGPASIGLESTVVDLTVSPPEVLRPGGVSLETLKHIISDVTFTPRYATIEDASSSPGMLLKHYAPRAQLVLFSGEAVDVIERMQVDMKAHLAEGQLVGIMAYDDEHEAFAEYPVQIVRLGSQNDLEEVGKNLFNAMRELDTHGVDIIFVRTLAAEGLGVAIHDRLLRAAEGQVIHVPTRDRTPDS